MIFYNLNNIYIYLNNIEILLINNFNIFLKYQKKKFLKNIYSKNTFHLTF